MRDILIFAAIFGLIPWMLKRPAIGALVFMWLSIMNPHRLAYGMAHDFPFAAVVAGITMFSVMISKEPRRFLFTPVTTLLLIFAAWMTLTSCFALSPEIAWSEWNRVSKTLLMVLITILVINTERDLKRLVWILGLSLGFYGLKGGLFTIMSGGSYRVWGPDGSYIGENNALALALVMTVPILWYLRLQAEKRWMRHGLELLAVLSIVSAAGSYSRGAMLGMGGMLGLLWLKSRHKFGTALGIALVVPLVFFAMPDAWTDRMLSVGQYQQDGSALGRINAWKFGIAIASNNIFGGGFLAFNPTLFRIYAPDPLDFHVAHSIYFQVLGEHGFIGLFLYLSILFATWRAASGIIKQCKNDLELKWMSDLAAMCQVSMVGYMLGGAFLSLAYYDFFYYVIAALVIMQKILLSRKVPTTPKVFNSVPAHQRRKIADQPGRANAG